MEGDKYQVKITANGFVGGTKKIIAYQGDATFATGEGLNITQFKDRFSYSAHTADGATLQFDMLLAAPLGEGAQLVWDAWRNKTVAYLYYEAADVGSQRVHGQFKIAIPNIDTAVSGLVIVPVTCTQVGKLVYEAVT